MEGPLQSESKNRQNPPLPRLMINFHSLSIKDY